MRWRMCCVAWLSCSKRVLRWTWQFPSSSVTRGTNPGVRRMAKDARDKEPETHTESSSSGELAGSRVAILAEALYEDMELWYPYYRLREAGADVFVVGSGSSETYQSKHGY